jgi:hypothetical protein
MDKRIVPDLMMAYHVLEGMPHTYKSQSGPDDDVTNNQTVWTYVPMILKPFTDFIMLPMHLQKVSISWCCIGVNMSYDFACSFVY